MNPESRCCRLRLAWTVLIALGCAACARAPRPQPVATVPIPPAPATTLTLTDALDREVMLERPAQRLVSLWPSTTEMICALGLGDRLVGVSTYCNYPPDVEKKEKVGDPTTPKIEKITALQPDLVFAAFGTSPDLIDQLERLNIAVFGLNPKTIEDVLRDMRVIGELTGAVAQAEEVIADLRKRLRAVTAKVPAGEERPRVYLEFWNEPRQTFGPGTFGHDLIEQAGGQNIFADADVAYPQVNDELVIERDPEVIILAYHEASIGEIEKRPAWQNLSAVRNGRVYRVDNPDLLLRPGPRLIEALEWLIPRLHPRTRLTKG